MPEYQNLTWKSAENFKISPEYITGKAPDIGAIEFGLDKKKSQKITSLQVDAGEDQAVEAPAATIVLAGRTRNADDESLSFATGNRNKGRQRQKS